MDYTVKEVLEFVEENDVKFIRLAFCDLLGTLKNISIMPSELPRAFESGISFDASAVKGMGEVKQSDLFLVPDPSTLSILPWRPQQGRVIRFYCDIKNPDGTNFECDSRNILKRTIEKMNQAGYGCNIGVECEFYLFKMDELGEPTEIPYDNGTYFDVAPLDKGENIRREICLCLEEMGIKPETSHHEQGPGQNEIDFKFSDPMNTADNLLTFKNVVSMIAERNGLYASFMPKPVAGKSGNGLHINLSLTQDGVNLLDGVFEQTTLVNQFMAGILDKITESTLFLNTLPSSYHRLGEWEAPKYISWSKENRSQLIRIPAAMKEKKRFELRSPDPNINPYIALALILEAGMEGLKNQMVLSDAIDEDMNGVEIDKLPDIKKLPESLKDAILISKDSTFVKNVIGEKVLNKFIGIKKEEL